MLNAGLPRVEMLRKEVDEQAKAMVGVCMVGRYCLEFTVHREDRLLVVIKGE